MLEKGVRIILQFEKILICISCAILICAMTAKAKHTCTCDNLISAHQNSARGRQSAQLALLKYSHFFLALRYLVAIYRMSCTNMNDIGCLCPHAWADLKHRHALYHSKIPAASAISTSYECYIRNRFKSVFRAIKPDILRHSP